MRYIYNINLVILLLFVHHMAFGQLNWSYINFYERGGSEVSSTLAYTGTTILSNGNILGCGLNVWDDLDSEASDNGIYGLMTLLSPKGEFIKDTLMEPGLFNYPIYVKDIPEDKSFFTVNWGLQSNTWYVLNWSYDLVLKSTDSIVFDYDGDIDEFKLIRYAEMKNGNIILNCFFEVNEYDYITMTMILDKKGNVIAEKVFKDFNVFNIFEKQDQSGYWGIGLDLVDFDNDFNITNVRKEVFIDKDEINVFNYKEKVIVSYITHNDDDTEDWKLDVMDSKLNFLNSIDLIKSKYFLNFNHKSIDIDDNGYIYIGISHTDDEYNFGIQLIKLDEEFDVVWKKRIVNQGYEFLGLNLEVNAKGEILLGGLAYSIESDDTGFGIILNVNNEKSSSTMDKNITLNHLTLYPNPAKNSIWIDSEIDLTGTNVKIVDVSGKLIYSTKLSADHSIDVGSVEKGLYFAKIDHEIKGYVTLPFIVE